MTSDETSPPVTPEEAAPRSLLGGDVSAPEARAALQTCAELAVEALVAAAAGQEPECARALDALKTTAFPHESFARRAYLLSAHIEAFACSRRVVL